MGNLSISSFKPLKPVKFGASAKLTFPNEAEAKAYRETIESHFTYSKGYKVVDEDPFQRKGSILQKGEDMVAIGYSRNTVRYADGADAKAFYASLTSVERQARQEQEDHIQRAKEARQRDWKAGKGIRLVSDHTLRIEAAQSSCAAFPILNAEHRKNEWDTLSGPEMSVEAFRKKFY